MEKLSKEELDEYLGRKEAQGYYKDLEKLNQYKLMWFTFNWRALTFMPVWFIKNRIWEIYIISYILMLLLVFYIPIRNELLFQGGSFWWITFLNVFIIYGLFILLFSSNEAVVKNAFKKVKKEGVLKQKKTTKTELWGWSLFFYFPLILSLSFKAPAFIEEITKPFDQKSHDEFEKALNELERPNPLQVLATGYLNNGKLDEPKPQGFEEYLGIDFEEEVDAFKEKVKALKNKGYDHFMQKGVKRQFIDNKDGTITDKSLGLMWQDTKQVGKATYKVNQIETVCRQRKKIGGYNDWKVPTAYELKSLMNFNEDKITDNVFKYGYDVKWEGFWSSTVNKNNDYRVLASSMINLYWLSNKNTALHLRCVRRLKKQKPVRKFDFIADVNRQVILDKGTSLMWQNEPYSYVEARTNYKDNRPAKIEIGKRMTQVHAMKYCKELELGGYDDWYVPNINQTMEIEAERRTFEYKEYLHLFTKAPAVWDEDEYYPSVHNSTIYTDVIRFVRCVRDAKKWNWEEK